MEYALKLTESEVMRLLIVLDIASKRSPTCENLFNEITKQTTVEL